MVGLGDLLTRLRRDGQIHIGAAKADIGVAWLLLRESSLLTFYIKSKKSKLLAKLLKADADVNFQDSIGMTPMMHAIENINIDAIKLLLSIDFIENLDAKITDYSGKTIFDYVENSRNNYLRKLIYDKKNAF